MSGDTQALITSTIQEFENHQQTVEAEKQMQSVVSAVASSDNDTLICPTCHGSGRITREQQNEQVALIPLSDKRLKPRRTLLYVAVSVVSCLVIGGLVCFFFIPRGITLSNHITTLNVTNCTIIIHTDSDKSESLNISFKNTFTVENNNYYSISLSDLHVISLLYNSPSPVVRQASNTSHLSIGARAKADVDVHMHLSLAGSNEDIYKYVCTNENPHPWGHTFLMNFEATVEAIVTGTSYKDSLMTYQHIICDFPQNSKTKPHCGQIHVNNTEAAWTIGYQPF